MTITLVIPFYNEKAILPGTAAACLSLRERLPGPLELIFVDDGSTDGGGACLEGLAVRLVSYPENRGKGYAIRQGVAASTGDAVVYTDCDLAYGLEAVRPAVNLLMTSGADVVCGSRRLAPEGYAAYPPLRRAASAGFSLLVNAVLGLGVSDTQCGFKCLRGDVARGLFSRCVTDGFSFDLELLGRAKRAGMKIAEMPVRVLRHGESKVRIFQDSLKMAGEVFAISRILRLETYNTDGPEKPARTEPDKRRKTMENLYFYLESCPYCRKADALFKEVVEHAPELSEALASFERIEETRDSARAGQYDYYYVPCCYVDGKKLHEGAMTLPQAEAVLKAVKAALEAGK
ncbi:MAG TPA: glycosyltransferase [Terriglobales bacterium]|nr:glycosyltransferase [Terriglobales bacterium]